MFQSGYTTGSIASFLTASKSPPKAEDESQEHKDLQDLFKDRPCAKEPKQKHKKKRKADDTLPGDVTDGGSPSAENDHRLDVDPETPCPKKKKKGREGDHAEDGVKKFKPDPEQDKRTIFVGNLPNTMTKKVLIKIFKRFGKVQSVRFRSAAPADPKLPKKAVVIKHEFHPERHNFNGYVVFEEESACQHALEMNGTKVEGNHIRVDRVAHHKHDHKRSVFVGNLPFKVEENAIYTFFADCGDIENVRIIRDKMSGVGKGFGYILFKRTDSVNLALKLHDQKLEGRTVRVERSSGPTVVSHNIVKRQRARSEKFQKKRRQKEKKAQKRPAEGTIKSTVKSETGHKKKMILDDFQGTKTKAQVQGHRLQKMKSKKKLKSRLDRKKKKKVANLLLGVPSVKQPKKDKKDHQEGMTKKKSKKKSPENERAIKKKGEKKHKKGSH